MYSYLLTGKVLPERAQISFSITGVHLQIGDEEIGIGVNIFFNQVAVHISTTREWDIFDLRNLMKTFLLNQLATVGYLKGYAYEMEITRIYSQEFNVDYVFGIEIPCLEQRGKSIDLTVALPDLLKKTSVHLGVFVNRCLTDLALSMKHADDTAFYCYRAIESLKQHCAIRTNLQSTKDAEQWSLFRKISGCDRADRSPERLPSRLQSHRWRPSWAWSSSDLPGSV